jgi:aspartate/methionine/tyrosine aminotransferase
MSKPSLPDMQISARVKAIPQALSIYINQLVYDLKRQGKDITALSLGEAYFDIPMFDFKKLDFVKGYHYSDSQGLPELRQKIAGFYKKVYGADIAADKEILISAGSKPIVFMSMQATINAGDEVLIHEPAWLSYQEHVRLVDGVPRFIPYDCPVKDFSRYFTGKTRMIVINNPNNPAGRVYTAAELHDLYAQCRPRGIYILVDEAYSDFLVEEAFCSMAKVVPDKNGIIIVNSLSKNMGMSGWRVGYTITHPTLLQQILKLNQHILTCGPTILLHYMARYFDRVTSITLPQVRDVVRKRQKIAAMIDSERLERMQGDATFYLFVSIGDFPGTALDFALYMLLFHGVSVVPGSAYGASTERFVRVSVGTESEERIHDAVLLMKDLIHSRHFDKARLDAKMTELGIQRFQ